ncbi:MAG: Rieske 2Fe-2S domain-containing protein [Methanomassiliicoccales archaeon]
MFGEDMTWVKVAEISSLPPEGLTRADANGVPVLIVTTGGKIYATQGLCTHEMDDLSNGSLENGNIVCGFHYATFQPSTGEVISQPQDGGEATPLKTYAVKIEDGKVLVDL